MKNQSRARRSLVCGILFLFAFAFFTFLLGRTDVQPIGPRGSRVGFAALNRRAHALLGVNCTLYAITDWLGLAPFLTTLCFAVFGLTQLIRRKGLLHVDGSILALGGFYTLVIAAYVLFELHPVNYRPVLIDGCLEASYPSSTTMLTLCVMPAAMMQLSRRIRSATRKKAANVLIGTFTAFMVIGRLMSGVHWLTDILGGALFSAAMLLLYRAAFLTAAR